MEIILKKGKIDFKIINIIFISLYFIFCIIIFLMLFGEILNIKIFDTSSVSSERFFFWFTLPMTIFLGAIAFITSYKAILIKLIPPVIITLILFVWESSATDGGLATAVAMIITVFFAIGLLIITFLARLISKKITIK